METKALIETLVITVMAALLGLSMPLIMQTVERLDSKYGSGVISTAFRKEWRYFSYFWMVWVSILSMLWLPCAPESIECLKDNWLVCNSAHILAWSSLTITLALLLFVFIRITKYESPEKLLSLISGVTSDTPGGSDDKIKMLVSNDAYFDQFGALMKYSMTVGNTPLFLSCNMVLGSCIGECRKEATNCSEVIYTDGIYNLINESLRISQRYVDELLYPALNNPQVFLTCYFDSSGKTIISDVTLRQLWINLNQLLRSDKPEWIKGYWAYVTQYADYTVSQRITTPTRLWDVENAKKDGKDMSDFDSGIIQEWNCLNSFREEGQQLRIFHHMFSSYLIYLGKTDIVRWTFTYTPSSIRTLYLLPHDISEIVKELSFISDNPIFLETNYSFFTENGIESGEMMRKWLVRYYIFALKEITAQFENALTMHDPWTSDTLFRTNDVKLIHKYKNIVNSLNGILYPDCEYFTSLDIDLGELKSISAKFDELFDNLDERIKELSKESEVDSNDIECANKTIDTELNTVLQNLNTSNPTLSGGNMANTEEVTLHVYLSVSKKDFVYNKDKFCQNAVPNILAMLHRQLMMHYTNTFRLSMSVKNINIDYTEISKAFNKLSLEKDGTYVALPIGVAIPNEYESVCEKPLAGFGQSQIIIMKRTDLPSVEIKRDPKTSILDYDSQSDKIKLTAELKATIITPPKLNFLRLIIVNSLFDGRKSELYSINPVRTYFS